MTNPFEIYRAIKAELPKKIDDLELTTIVGSNENWDSTKECKAAIVTVLLRRDLLTDPVLFAHTTQGLMGILPDFEELEIPNIEDINTALEFIMYVSKDLKLAYTQMSEDLKSYIAICCLEEGLFFLKNRLSVLQDKVIEISKISYNPAVEEDIKRCEKLWSDLESVSAEELDPKTPEEMQVLLNKIMANYTNLLKHVPTEAEKMQEPEVPGK